MVNSPNFRQTAVCYVNIYLTRIIHESQTRPWDSLHNVL
jgi:hypothetical protein